LKLFFLRVRRERDRLEKMMKEVAGLDRKVPDDPEVRTTVDGQGGSVTALTGTMCNIVQSQHMIYGTEEEPSAGISNGPGAGQGGSVTAQTGKMCNIVEPITVLQENYETDEEEFSGGKNNTQKTEAGPGGSVTLGI
jgi:hypothetical protein